VFVFVGSEVNADEWKCDASEVIDLQGSTVFPGFTDSHQHLEGVGRRTKTLSLFGITSLKATVSRIRDWSEQILEGG
jgi:predicted amidohydrolase YtcJ